MTVREATHVRERGRRQLTPQGRVAADTWLRCRRNQHPPPAVLRVARRAARGLERRDGNAAGRVPRRTAMAPLTCRIGDLGEGLGMARRASLAERSMRERQWSAAPQGLEPVGGEWRRRRLGSRHRIPPADEQRHSAHRQRDREGRPRKRPAREEPTLDPHPCAPAVPPPPARARIPRPSSRARRAARGARSEARRRARAGHRYEPGRSPRRRAPPWPRGTGGRRAPRAHSGGALPSARRAGGGCRCRGPPSHARPPPAARARRAGRIACG